MATKLISMVDFILEIDWLTTAEFCDKNKLPHPHFTGEVKSSAEQFINLDMVKKRMFIEYAKFLNKKLTLDMFVGKKPIFEGFEVNKDFENKDVLRRVGESQVFAYLDDEPFKMHFPRSASRIEDLLAINSVVEFYYNITFK